MKDSLEKWEIYEQRNDPEGVIKEAFRVFGENVVMACSFGAEDVVIFDIIARVAPNIPVFTIDTGRLPQETYEVWERLEERYGKKIIPYFPDKEKVEKMVSEHGPNLFYKSVELRKLCCHVRKVEPLQRALKGKNAWICGLRREQAVTRAGIKMVEVDHANGGIVKINPLVLWKTEDVWNYIKKHRVPYNKLHDKNYPSIGCAPCTRSVKPGEDIRAGRWWWESPEHKECGLHRR